MIFFLTFCCCFSPSLFWYCFCTEYTYKLGLNLQEYVSDEASKEMECKNKDETSNILV